jgi:tetratricopeptide (TPR) repeat protein
MNENSFAKSFLGSVLIVLALVSQITLANQNGIDAYESRDLTEAKKIFNESLKVNDKEPIALHYLAKIALKESELDQAEEYIEKAIENDPENAKVHFDAARIMGAQAQDSSVFSAPGYAKSALKFFKSAAELEPKTIKYRQGLMSFYLQAPSFLGGDVDLAMSEANAISKLDPSQGFIALANVYQNTDKKEQLKLHYASVEEKFADNANILFARGLYYQSEEDFVKAVNDFKRVQTLKPVDDTDQTIYAAQYQIGRTSVLSKGNYEEGKQALHQYIDTAPEADGLPSKAWAMYRLGILYKETDEKTTAKKLYKEAKMEAKDKQLQKSLKKAIKKLR